jgi:ubiquinone/menaquinone biosynthesis C-methylase UbiE
MARANRQTEAEALAELAPGPDDDVLVIGFGPGVGLELLARVVTGGFMAGIDPSPVMLREARRRNRAAIASARMELRQATDDALPWLDKTFDGVLAVNTIQLWNPLAEGVAEVARVLRPGGRFVTFTHDWAIRRSTGREVEDWAADVTATCRENGLTDAKWWRATAESGRSIAFTAQRA